MILFILCVLIYVLCIIIQESQVGSYIDDKTLRRKYTNTVDHQHLLQQKKDDTGSETTNRSVKVIYA